MSGFKFDPNAPEFIPSSTHSSSWNFVLPAARYAPSYPSQEGFAFELPYRPVQSFYHEAFSRPNFHARLHFMEQYPSLPAEMYHRPFIFGPVPDFGMNLDEMLESVYQHVQILSRSQVRLPERVQKCSICDDNDALVNVGEDQGGEHYSQNTCSHSFCSSCLQQWIASKLSELQRHIGCPAEGCKYVLYPADIERIAPDLAPRHKELLSQDYRARFQSLVKEDAEMAEFMRQNAVACPDCRVLMVKSEGCDTMRCTCGVQFCYRCQQMFMGEEARCGCQWMDEDLSTPFTCPRCTFVNERTGHYCEACEVFRYSDDEEQDQDTDQDSYRTRSEDIDHQLEEAEDEEEHRYYYADEHFHRFDHLMDRY